jgi:hypothetical protein
MIMYPNRKEGIVIMTNGEKGQLLIEEILRGQSLISGWTDYKVKKKILSTLPDSYAERYIGTYILDEYPTIQVVITKRGVDLMMKVVQPGIKPLEAKLYYEGNEQFFRLDIDMEVTFLEQQRKMRLVQSGQVFTGSKFSNDN